MRLPPFRNGIRVVQYWGGRTKVRVDIEGVGGFDMTKEDFADDAKLELAIKAASIPVRPEDVRSAA